MFVDNDGETWAGEMRGCLSGAVSAAREARENGGVMPEAEIAGIEDEYGALTGEGIRYHEGLPQLPSKGRGRRKRRPGHNLAIRLRDCKMKVLKFLRRPGAEPTDNSAERAVRPLKVKQKISGSFRTGSGAADFAVLRSVVETAKRHRAGTCFPRSGQIRRS